MNIIVIGAGPGGLTAAWNLIQDGHKVLVLEKEDHCGGASYTFKKDGFRYDYGPHILHSHRISLIQFFQKILGVHLLRFENCPTEIYFQKRRFNYPLGGEALFDLPLFVSIRCGFSFLLQRLRLFFGLVKKEDGSYKTWIVNHFGEQFYNIFFGPYTEKTWGIPAELLSDTVAKKRISVKGLSDLVRSLIFKTSSVDPNHNESHRNMVRMYSKYGVGEISEFFVNEINKLGGEILTGCTVNGITFENHKVTGIRYQQDGKDIEIEFEKEGGVGQWAVISTAPINEILLASQSILPEEVKKAAVNLDFSSEVFLYLNLNQMDGFGVPLLYFSEDEFPFNRVYDIRLLSPDMVPVGKNAICLEYTCTYDDEIWNATDEQLFEMAISPLERNGLFKREAVESVQTVHLKHAYPRFRVGYQLKLRTIFNFIESIENFDSFGRQGLFSYANIDEVIWMAFQVTKHLSYKQRLNLPLEELLPDYIDF